MATAAFFFFVYRGLYDAIPILLATAIAVIGSYLGVVFFRMLTRVTVRINRHALKEASRTSRLGRGFLFLAALHLRNLLEIKPDDIGARKRLGRLLSEQKIINYSSIIR